MAKIKGLDQWFRKTDNKSKELEESVKSLIAETAYKIESDAKKLTPVDTGNLRRSIKTDIKEDGLTAEIGTNVEYAIYVEFGTSKQPARPYLTPAYVKQKKKFNDGLRDIVKGIGD